MRFEMKSSSSDSDEHGDAGARAELRVLLVEDSPVICGLIAEIIMRTYYESQGKQVYLVKNTLNLAGPL